MTVRTDLRCRDEDALYAALLDDPRVGAAVKALGEMDELGARRALLGTAVRLTERMAPALVGHVEACRATLGIETDVELFVYPQADLNAACVRPENGRVFVLLSAGLVDTLLDSELRFVVGHELAHHLFGHHEMPVGVLTQGEDPVGGPIALKLFAWSRFAEISADRAGVLCAGDVDASTRALFRVATGIRGDAVRMHVDDLLAQMGDMRDEIARAELSRSRADWFSTHPFSPLRLRAVQLFAGSALFAGHGLDRDALEEETHALLSLMDPSYLEEESDEAVWMRRLLFAGGAAVAAASGGLAEEEIAVMRRFFGEARFGPDVRVDALRADLDRRAADVRERVPALRRAQVLRDLCLVALADGRADRAERAVILGLADRAGVDRRVVEQALGARVALD
jgi:hypothetical protein